ncbi:MAG: ferritin-like domain-containing protein [Pseudomonadota bacterium]
MTSASLSSFMQCDPAAKCAEVAALTHLAPVASMPLQPGRPAQPLLVRPREVPQRGLGSVEGRAALCHAVAHIEFNAINLALDAGLRFGGMPEAYYADWLSVAQDEARHFLMMRARLQQLGYDYGDFAAHNGLWESAEKTAHDLLVRMACVPRVLEARGLDVTPNLINRLREVRDTETMAVLEVILAEEVRHVEIGTHWFHHCCAERGLEPVATFRRLLQEQNITLRPPFNEAARKAAGFVPEELAAWGL